MKKYYVYSHYFDNGVPFYIGATSKKTRPYDFKNRSKEWLEIVTNHPIEVRVTVWEVESKQAAKEMERRLIEENRETVCNGKKEAAYQGCATLLPTMDKCLSALVTNIILGRKRRKWSSSMLAERAGMSRSTLQEIEKGNPGVSIGHYLNVLFVLGFHETISSIGANDPVGRHLQDAALLRK